MTPLNKTMNLIELIRELNEELKSAKEIQIAVAKIVNSSGQKLDTLATNLENINELAQVLKENNKYITHINPIEKSSKGETNE